jgi:hypothetical protein
MRLTENYYNLLLAMVLVAMTNTSSASNLTDANAIMEKSDLATFYNGKDGRADVRMEIFDKKGQKQRRQFTVIRRNSQGEHWSGGDQQLLILFSRPSDIKRTVFRVEKHVNQDDDRWLYLPGLDLVKRIAAGDKRTSFVGSHFFYEDISGRNTEEDIHQLIEVTDKYYVIKSTPKDPEKVEFSYYKAWIDKDSFVKIRYEYIDNASKVYRRIETQAVKNIDGYQSITKLRVDDLRSGGYSINEYKFIKYDINIPSQVFSERSLRSPPRKWFTRVRG